MSLFGARVRAAVCLIRPERLTTLLRGRRYSLADALMVLTMLIWSLNITSVKVVVGVIPPLGFGLLRYGAATVVLFLILWQQERSVRVRRADLGWLALSGAIGFGLNQMGFLLGIQRVSASLAAIILATSPLIAAAVAALWAGEPLRRPTLLAMLVSFTGVLVVIAGAGLHVRATLSGGLLILLSAATLALSTVLIKRPLQYHSTLRVTAWASLFGCITLLPLGAPALISTPGSLITSKIMLAVAFTIFGSTVFGNLAWNYAIQQLGAARTTVYTYLQPVLGVTIAVILLGDRLAVVQVLGGVVVLAGLVLYPKRASPAPKVENGDAFAAEESHHLGTQRSVEAKP
jgi:drug/metabolite transporter (DMT)-like permease